VEDDTVGGVFYKVRVKFRIGFPRMDFGIFPNQGGQLAEYPNITTYVPHHAGNEILCYQAAKVVLITHEYISVYVIHGSEMVATYFLESYRS
jgi:hypothetical protein